MEAIVVKAVARELARELPARVHAVLQPSPRQIVIVVRGAAERRLLLSVDPEAPRLHLVGSRPAVLPSPTAFCRLLRKRLEGRVLSRVESPGVERVVTLGFDAPGTAAGGLSLIAELMGKHSNLILVEGCGGLVVDSLQHVGVPMSRVRTVLPGVPYVEPPACGRAAWDELDAAAFAAIWEEAGGGAEGLFRRVLGLGPGTLALAAGRARLQPGFSSAPGALVHAELLGCLERALRGDCRPVFYPERAVLLTEPVPGWEDQPQCGAPTMNEAAELFHREWLGRRGAARLRDERTRELGRALKKLAAEEERRRREILEAGDAEFYQAAGTALTLAAAGVPKGSVRFAVADPRSGGPREVALDARLGPRQNAEALFRLARKIKRRGALALQKLPAVAARRRQLDEERELVSTGSPGPPAVPPPAAAAPGRRSASGGGAGPLPGIREYRSPQGWRILVGKSGKGNDHLTGRVAAPEDYWLHVRGYPGAHVVLKNAGGEPPGEALLAAAGIAAWHSGARSERMVDVSYTKRKNVRKVKGGPPGTVTLGEEATVRVSPGVPAGVEERSA